MFFWILAAIMTAMATAALLYPLGRGRAVPAAADHEHDVEVYRDQLAEIDRDLAGGQIGEAEAETARAEIGRRLIAAARRGETGQGGRTERAAGGPRLALLAVLLVMPALGLGLYFVLGSPDVPQQPLAARLDQDPEKADINILVASAERHLAANPEDGRGWDVLGPIYLRMGRIAEAETAFRKAIALLGPSAARQGGLGEAIVANAGGIVTDEAQVVFQSARELDPTDPRPAFFLALALAQEGRSADARAAFESLAARSAPDAPWLPSVNRQLAMLDRDKAGSNGVAMPSAAEIAAAAEGKTPAERAEMISSMVATLEARLAANPDNLDGWLMLMRSRATLGDLAGAQAALDKASAAFPAGAGAQALARLAGELGLKPNSGLGGVPISGAGAAPEKQAPAAPAAPAAPFMMTSPAAPSGPAAGSGPAAAPGNPTAADIAAAQAMAPEDRMDMVRSMVASLDAKLAEDPANIEGWLRLVRSYAVLGDRDAAASALDRGRAAFAGDSPERKALDGLAAELALDQQDKR